MTEQNIFVYKPFLSLNINISDLSLFLRKKCTPNPEKGHLHLPLSQQLTSKNWNPVKLLFLEIW